MKLGEMLVRDGRLTTEQLDQAIARQAKDGGRFGTVLVEMGLIDGETLTVYLGLELGIPIATGATLERCKRSAVRLLKPEQAMRYRCIPIVIQGQTLIAALDDPHDFQTLDALASITGYRVIPRVAPEIRIFYYLERFYGVPRPKRFRALGDAPRGNREFSLRASNLPAPPLPGLPPRREAVAAPTPAPVLRQAPRETPEPPKTPPAVPAAQEALEIDAADLVVELEADEAEVAGEAPPAEAMAAIAGGTQVRSESTDYEPVDLDTARQLMDSAERRGMVADAVLRYAAGLFEVGALFMVRDNMAFGWKGFGPGLDRDRIETLLIPLDAPSMLQVAIHSEQLFRGRAFPATIHNHLFKVLRCPMPAVSVVVAISIGRRTVNLLYGHPPDGNEITEEQVDDLRTLADAATATYVRLITVSKKRRQDSDSEGSASSEVGDDSAQEVETKEDLDASPGGNEPAGDADKSPDADAAER